MSMESVRRTSPDLTADHIRRLAELFPAVVTEARDADGRVTRAVDFDLLRQELSDHVVEGPQERYQLDWPGKREAVFAANAPTTATLRPDREESVDFDTTKNVFIEGDNLEVLKVLQESYLGKVKMIYIDPPYNTGNDFVYNDDFAESTKDYLRRSGAVDEDGARLCANPESNGRFHSDWLSMMYPRLKLARNLLTDDGAIFASISDDESHNLIAILSEIFGRENHVATFTWVKKRKGSHLSKTTRSMTEHIVCFARNIRNLELVGEAAYGNKWQPLAKRTNSNKTLNFPAASIEARLPDDTYPPGRYGVGSSALLFEDEFTVEDGTIVGAINVTGPFVWGQEMLTRELSLGTHVSLSSRFGFNVLRHNQSEKVKRPSTLIDKSVGAGTNEDAYEGSVRLFGAEGVMSYPKPTSLIEYLVRSATWNSPDAVIMDFFAGSGTTGHAVMKLNASHGTSLRHIQVQLNEHLADDTSAAQMGLSSIPAVARERLRRAGQAVAETSGAENLDTGFRAFRLDSSPFVERSFTPDSITPDLLAELEDPLLPDRTPADLLTHVLLAWGLDLAVDIQTVELAEQQVFDVEEGALLAAFGAQVTDDLAHAMARREPARAVFLDSDFTSDAARINVEQIFREISPTTDVKVL